ncbi:MAG: Hsp20/alpha crystallin family protein [Promethearchaeota archaeon]
MALVENKQSEAMQETAEQKDNEIYYRVYPDMRRRMNYKDKTVHFDVSMPGVKKENIELKALSTWFHITGSRGHMQYSANQAFGFEIAPEKTEAKYDQGLLHITAHIRDPLDDAKEIEI